MRIRWMSPAWLSLLMAAPASGASAPTVLTLWPGYTIGLPASHCVQVSQGPDFKVLYLRDAATPGTPVLLGIYEGHNPEEPACGKAVPKEGTANGLSVKSVRGDGGCAEFLFQDPKKPERGYLHMWFGPGAKSHPDLAEGVVASVRPAPLPVNASDLPLCK